MREALASKQKARKPAPAPAAPLPAEEAQGKEPGPESPSLGIATDTGPDGKQMPPDDDFDDGDVGMCSIPLDLPPPEACPPVHVGQAVVVETVDLGRVPALVEAPLVDNADVAGDGEVNGSSSDFKRRPAPIRRRTQSRGVLREQAKLAQEERAREDSEMESLLIVEGVSEELVPQDPGGEVPAPDIVKHTGPQIGVSLGELSDSRSTLRKVKKAVENPTPEPPVVIGEEARALSPRSTLLAHACPVCSIGFSDQSMLMTHLKTQHKGAPTPEPESPVDPPPAKQTQKSPRTFIVTGGSKSPRGGGKSPRSAQYLPHSCPVCRKGFVEKDELLVHLAEFCGKGANSTTTARAEENEEEEVWVSFDGMGKAFHLTPVLTVSELLLLFSSHLRSVRPDSQVDGAWLSSSSAGRLEASLILANQPERSFVFNLESTGVEDDTLEMVLEDAGVEEAVVATTRKPSFQEMMMKLDAAPSRHSGVFPDVSKLTSPRVMELDALIAEARELNETQPVSADPVQEWLQQPILSPSRQHPLTSMLSPGRSDSGISDSEGSGDAAEDAKSTLEVPNGRPRTGSTAAAELLRRAQWQDAESQSRSSMHVVEVGSSSDGLHSGASGSDFDSSTDE